MKKIEDKSMKYKNIWMVGGRKNQREAETKTTVYQHTPN